MPFLVQDAQMDAACQECRQEKDWEMGGLKISLEEMGKIQCVIGRVAFILFLGNIYSRCPHTSSRCSLCQKPALWTSESGIKMGEKGNTCLAPSPPHTYISRTPLRHPFQKRRKKNRSDWKKFLEEKDSLHSVDRTEICAFHSLAIHFEKRLFSSSK
ncbi:hypothetical protein CEXT_645361 [Caerostris extrusa]|uniref:Uncharacterized protein n=1 Tax=Caerostris extrusa TaxID=172846 RepID=A0AAV4URT1_CAEEX|nr:hypothetical protein CEXT_645361 [Caerostris extrusa]